MFSKKPAARPYPEKQPSKPMARGNSSGGQGTFSVIGQDVTITGNIAATTELHVDGRIDGDIACASLVQGEASTINGAIDAETARVAGTVQGSIVARDLVVLASARVEGDVRYDSITIEQGAQVEGKFAHRDGGQAQSSGQGKQKSADAPEKDELVLTVAS